MEDHRESVTFATLEHLVYWITWRFTASTGLSGESVGFEAFELDKAESHAVVYSKSDKWLGGGGFKCLLFSPLFGEYSHFD